LSQITETLRQRQSFLTAKDVAKLLNISEDTVLRYQDLGHLPGLKFGDMRRFDPEDLADFIENRHKVPRIKGSYPTPITWAETKPGDILAIESEDEQGREIRIGILGSKTHCCWLVQLAEVNDGGKIVDGAAGVQIDVDGKRLFFLGESR
jgi:excisionase family DNA binding protein